MDAFELSRQKLTQYLAESSIAERKQLWAEVKATGIKGPTLSEYLNEVQVQMESFNNSFAGGTGHIRQEFFKNQIHTTATASVEGAKQQWNLAGEFCYDQAA